MLFEDLESEFLDLLSPNETVEKVQRWHCGCSHSLRNQRLTNLVRLRNGGSWVFLTVFLEINGKARFLTLPLPPPNSYALEWTDY